MEEACAPRDASLSRNSHMFSCPGAIQTLSFWGLMECSFYRYGRLANWIRVYSLKLAY